jgi:antitoxin MazE
MLTAKKPIVGHGKVAAGLRSAGAKRRASPKQANEGPQRRTLEAKVVAIGNARGVRLPEAMLAKCAIGDAILLEERDEGVLLRAKSDERLSWEDTYKEMAREREDFSDLDPTVGDGLDREPW